MSEARIRVVVGEGRSPRKGLLRFVLEGDGYDVVGEATTAAELARVIADQRPDVVVLDDGIGATAPQVVHEIAPRTKVVLVWPGAVVPIGGDVRVEPSQVLRELGPAVAKVAGGVAGLTFIDRPEWIDKVRKDPSTLREMLERRGGLPTKRPSVTELQRRGQRLHAASTSPSEEEPTPVAPVVPIAIPLGEAMIDLPDHPDQEVVLNLPEEGSEGDRTAVVPLAAAATLASGSAGLSAAERNRRLGAIALGGAAVIGAVVFALALGGSRVPTDIIMAEGPRATIVPGPPIDSGTDEPGHGGQEQGPDGGQAPIEEPANGGLPLPGTPPAPGTGGGSEPSPPPDRGGTEPPPSIPGGGGTPTVTAPGKSATHNPHGSPPGQTPDPSGPSGGGSVPSGNGATHWADGLPGHAGEHGQGIEHGNGLDKLKHTHKT